MKRYFFGKDPRAVATFVCHVVNGTSQRAKELLEHELERSGFSRRDKDLATELVYGALRRRGTLDHLLGEVSRISLRKVQPRILEILRLAAYQILFLDKIPASAAVDEAAKIARRVSSKGAVGFVNGCLRSLCRSIVGKREEPGDEPRAALPVGDGLYCVFRRPVLPCPRGMPAEHLAAAYSHPVWLVRRWLERCGEKATRRLCERGNIAPLIVLRVNRARATQETLLGELAGEGRWAKPLGGEHVALDQAGALAELRALREGLCTVQGIAASAAAPMVAPTPGERILDLCSAPGSKACQLAELAEGRATIIALDISPRRAQQILANAQRLGARGIQPLVADAATCERLCREPFDAVLLDVPCSNTGVLARRVESRWRLTEARLQNLAELQRRLLDAAAQVVRPGGRLVYSTCSLEAEENEQAIERLCRERADYKVTESRLFLPSETHDDGGYAAVLRRKQ